MNKYFSPLIVVMVLFFSINGCVTQGTYQKKVGELDDKYNSLQQKCANENNTMKDKITTLIADREQLKEAFVNATRGKEELEKVLQSKSDALAKSIVELKKINAELEGENQILAENLIHQKHLKEEEIDAIKKVHNDLILEMKDEMDKGLITITASKAKLSVGVQDKVLFDSGEVEIKTEGQAVLQRLIGIIKNVWNKPIRIEGHMDNIKIKGQSSKKYPTGWELAAAQAIAVTRFFQKQGIDPVNLIAISYGEYRPVADNNSSDGLAGNRRITITLLATE